MVRTMLPSEAIFAAKNPTEALNVVAALLDQYEKRLQELEAAGVSEWDQWSGETPPLTDDGLDDAERQAINDEIEDLERQLQGNEDAQESEALRAQILLAQDKLLPKHVEPDLDQERTTPIVDDQGNVINEVPAVSPEKEALRWEFAEKALKLEEIYGEAAGKEYIQSYAKAGPLLLYYTDRDTVMTFNDDIKRAMVEDVFEQSPKEGHEMSRDILKDLEANGPDVSVENIVRTMQ